MYNTYISDLLIDAIGITLINSIWQGLVVLMILYLLLQVVPKSKVQFKYWLSVTALTGILFWSGYTFFNEVLPVPESEGAVLSNPERINLAHASQTLMEFSAVSTFKEQLGQWTFWLQPHMDTIVVIWLAGVMLFLIRLQGSVYYLRRLQSIGTQKVSPGWQLKIEELSDRLGITKRVQAYESTIAGIPMVIGHLKPVILIPAGMLSGLQPKEIEAILAHELAHVKRFDYLINMVQTVVESMLFFNPAVWWISHTIRKHREHCCDDVAVKYCGNQLEYANALSNLGAWSLKTPALGMGLFKNKNELLMRIKRLVYPQTGSRTLKEKLIPGVILMLTLMCFTWYSHKVQAQLAPVPQPALADFGETVVAPGKEQVLDTIPEEQEALPPMEPVPQTDDSWFEDPEIEVEVEVTPPEFHVQPPVEEFFGYTAIPDVDELVELSLSLSPYIDLDINPMVDSQVDPWVDMEVIEQVIAQAQFQFNDTTRERIREALEAQRDALEKAREEQSRALEQARAQLQESLKADRPEDLTEEEWAMAKEQIARAEKSVAQAMRQSEKALERALAAQELEFHQAERFARNHHGITHAHKERIQRQVERVASEQARIQREVARAHGNAALHRYGSSMHSGKEAQLRRTLKEDGLIDSFNSDISLSFTKSQIKINGVKLQGTVKEKYREVLDDMYGRNSTGELEFKD
jgi:beta-lactamase regulating signal transducer with metallopeptidase domain